MRPKIGPSRAIPYIKRALLTYGGDYLEIGTRYGEGLIPLLDIADTITCIDPMETLPPQPGYQEWELGTEEAFWENVGKFADKVELVIALSQPWPESLENCRWSVVFIDGEHTLEAVKSDLKNVASRTENAIIIDDVRGQTKEMIKVFLDQSEEWELYSTVEGDVWLIGRKR